MADETRDIIIDVEVTGKADEEIGKLNTTIKKNRDEIKELNKDYAKNATEIAKLERENKKLGASKTELIKDSKAEKGSLNDLRRELSRQTKERNNLNKTTVEGKKRFDELQKSIAGLNETISKDEEAGGDFRRNVGNYPQLFASAAGGIKVFGTSLTDVFNVIKANPIILLITAIAGLVKAFSQSQTGIEFFRKTSAILNTTLGFLSDIVESLGGRLIDAFENPQQALRDFGNLIRDNIVNRLEGMFELLPKIGEAISLLFEGKFAEAGKVALDAVAKVTLGVEDFTEKVVEATTATVDFFSEVLAGAEAAGVLEEQLIANEKALADLRVSQAQSIKSQKELNLVVEDTTKTFEERIDAAQRFADVEEEQITKSIRLQQQLIDILKAQNDITNSTEEDLQRVRDAEIELANLQAASFEREVTNNNKLNTILTQQTTERLAAQKAITDSISAGIAKTVKEQEEAAKKSIALAKVESAAKQQFQNDLFSNTLAVLGETSTVGKAVASIQAGINITEGITKALGAAPPPFNFLLAGLTAAAGAKQIANINSTQVGTSAISSGSGSGSISSTVASGVSGIAGGLANVNASLLSQFSTAPTAASDSAAATVDAVGNLPAIEVSVVEITDAQTNVETKVVEATLGG